MPDSDDNRAYSALNDLLAHWQAGKASPDNRADIQRLQLLIDSDVLEGLWKLVSTNRSAKDAENEARLLLSELFDAARRIPPWEARTGTQRKTRLDQIDKAANRLAELISDSPIRYLSEDAISEMRLAVPPLSAGPGIRRVGDPDFIIALADLRDQAEIHRGIMPTLRRPRHEDAHRRYFVLRTQRYLWRQIGTRSNKLIAELAKIMLRDDEINAEAVRKILS